MKYAAFVGFFLISLALTVSAQIQQPECYLLREAEMSEKAIQIPKPKFDPLNPRVPGDDEHLVAASISEKEIDKYRKEAPGFPIGSDFMKQAAEKPGTNKSNTLAI